MFNDQLLMIARYCGLHEMLIRSTHIPQAIQNIVFTWLNVVPRIVIDWYHNHFQTYGV